MSDRSVTADVLAAAVIAPGLPDWATARPVLRGEAPFVSQPAVVPPPERLPPAERRRAGTAVKLAVDLADAACKQAGLDAASLPTVFTSSSGDGANCHALCETLAGSDRLISPTRFTNSVHNAASGYWHIAVKGMDAATSLCAHDATFAAGLLEAVLQARAAQRPVLLVCSDAPYPEPLHGVRPLVDSVGVALVVAPRSDASALGRIALSFGAGGEPSTLCRDDGIEFLRQRAPAGRALTLLQALADGTPQRVVLEYQPSLSFRVDLGGA